MNCIVVVDNNWGIGKNGDLLVRNPIDMKFFTAKTSGNVVIMGRKTLESFPGGRPLKNRTNLVLSRSFSNDGQEGVKYFSTVEDLLRECQNYDPSSLFVIGGGEIYHRLLEYCDTAYVTYMDKSFDVDTWFPNLDVQDEWELAEVSDKDVLDDFTFAFRTYKKKDK